MRSKPKYFIMATARSLPTGQSVLGSGSGRTHWRGVMERRTATDRRQFIKVCATAAATVASYPETLIGSVNQGQFFNRVQLRDENDTPLKANNLITDESYLFFYPYISTPCFLIRLDKSIRRVVSLATQQGTQYDWQGGVGPQNQIVSFSAICAHKMSHPSVQVSFINYRPEEVQYAGHDNRFHRRSNVIYCCSEGSVYDPAEGGRVLGGPAPNPLAAILLEHDPQTDHLFAVGVAGKSMFASYFKTFAHRLELEFKDEVVDQAVEGTAEVVPLDRYCARQVLC